MSLVLLLLVGNVSISTKLNVSVIRSQNRMAEREFYDAQVGDSFHGPSVCGITCQ